MPDDMQRVAIISGWTGQLPDYVSDARANHRVYAAKHGYDYVWFDEKEISALMGGARLTPQSTWWLKPYVLRSTLETGYDAVFWTDADSLFVNQSVGMEDLLESSASFIFAGDAWDLCSAGHLWFRNTSFTSRFLELWTDWENVPVEDLATTHQNSDGTLGDQPALNILLRGGPLVSPVDARFYFNQVNGYMGNKSRVHKFFRWTHSPTTRFGVKNAQRLIHADFGAECKVVPQARLNAYPFTLLPGIAATKSSPIVHFPGEHKDKMSRFL